MKHIAIIGTQGIPAQYGGFESLVENLVKYRSTSTITYTVFCSSKDLQTKIKTYNGITLRYIPLHANGTQSILYDIYSLILARKNYDTILVLGVSGCIFLPIFCLFNHKKLLINIDGLEHKREKWNKAIKLFLRISEKFAIKYGSIIIADNKGIQDYVTKHYRRPSQLIAYGGDHALVKAQGINEDKILNTYKLASNNYAITICRIEPENNCHIILEAFKTNHKKLIFIGNWDRSDYGKNLRQKYSKYANIIMHPPIYDLNTLYVLRKNASIYVHGHSAGGTNPSLVEAMFFGRPIIAYDVIYNRETTENKAIYFKDSISLNDIITATIDPQIGDLLHQIALKRYTWEHIVKQYEELY